MLLCVVFIVPYNATCPLFVIDRLQQRAKVMPKNWDQFLARTPQDDVWIRTYYAKPTFPFEECIAMHREFAAPEMSNNLNGLVHMEAVLNLTTKKKVQIIAGSLYGNSKRILFSLAFHIRWTVGVSTLAIYNSPLPSSPPFSDLDLHRTFLISFLFDVLSPL